MLHVVCSFPSLLFSSSSTSLCPDLLLLLFSSTNLETWESLFHLFFSIFYCYFYYYSCILSLSISICSRSLDYFCLTSPSESVAIRAQIPGNRLDDFRSTVSVSLSFFLFFFYSSQSSLLLSVSVSVCLCLCTYLHTLPTVSALSCTPRLLSAAVECDCRTPDSALRKGRFVSVGLLVRKSGFAGLSLWFFSLCCFNSALFFFCSVLALSIPSCRGPRPLQSCRARLTSPSS